MDGTASK